MTPEEAAEKVAGPHEFSKFPYECLARLALGPCNCPRRERVQAIAQGFRDWYEKGRRSAPIGAEAWHAED